MSSIPVGRTIARAYGFAAGRFIRVIGLTWLSAFFLALTAIYCLSHLDTDLDRFSHGGGGALRFAMLGDVALLAAATLFFGSTIVVPLAREALGLHDEFVVAHFVVGIREVRLFFALLRFVMVVAAAVAALGLTATLAMQYGLIHAIASVLPGQHQFSPEVGDVWRGVPLRLVVGGAIGVIGLAVLLLLTLRLGFFLVPVAAIEDRVTIRRASKLSRGNFWRMLCISALLLLPVAAVTAMVVAAIAGREAAGSDITQFAARNAVSLAAIGAVAFSLALTLLAGATTAAYQLINVDSEAVEVSAPPAPQPARTDRRRKQPDFVGVPATAVATAEIPHNAPSPVSDFIALPVEPVPVTRVETEAVVLHNAETPTPATDAAVVGEQAHPLATLMAATDASAQPGEHEGQGTNEAAASAAASHADPVEVRAEGAELDAQMSAPEATHADPMSTIEDQPPALPLEASEAAPAHEGAA